MSDLETMYPIGTKGGVSSDMPRGCHASVTGHDCVLNTLIVQVESQDEIWTDFVEPEDFFTSGKALVAQSYINDLEDLLLDAVGDLGLVLTENMTIGEILTKLVVFRNEAEKNTNLDDPWNFGWVEPEGFLAKMGLE